MVIKSEIGRRNANDTKFIGQKLSPLDIDIALRNTYNMSYRFGSNANLFRGWLAKERRETKGAR
jgi:hypothetical protein